MLTMDLTAVHCPFLMLSLKEIFLVIIQTAFLYVTLTEIYVYMLHFEILLSSWVARYHKLKVN